MNALLRRLGIDYPIIGAPMGGGPTTPELVAAVSNAGGLGSLAGAYFTPEKLTEQVQRVRELTERPFAINLFAGGYGPKPEVDPGPMLRLLGEIHSELGLPAPALEQEPLDPFPGQLETVLAERPAVFSFTFGIPGRAAMSRLKGAGIFIMGTATTAHEGRLLAEAGVDAIIAQGAEAGAHRGTFAASFETSLVPTLQLVRELVGLSLPIIASGGLMDGADIRAALETGASAVQLGTAFLASPESAASPAYKRAILDAKRDSTVLTRAFSGRAARGLENDFIRRVPEAAILPFPLQNALTRAMRTAAGKRGDTRFLSLWAGQGVARARAMPAGELVRVLVREMRQT